MSLQSGKIQININYSRSGKKDMKNHGLIKTLPKKKPHFVKIDK